jgi:hypothetical protein
MWPRACRLRAFGGRPRPTSNARPRIDDRIGRGVGVLGDCGRLAAVTASAARAESLALLNNEKWESANFGTVCRDTGASRKSSFSRRRPPFSLLPLPSPYPR